MSDFRFHPDVRLGPVHLVVGDLGRALEFYQGVLGLQPQRRADGATAIGPTGDEPIVLLTEILSARPRPARSTGLYHYAILLPDRSDLAQAIERLLDVRYPLQGASDHGVSEALYLADPDGNGIEIYRDRPRDEWPREGDRLKMVTEALDADAVMGSLEARRAAGDAQDWAGLPAGTRIGHVHLHVSDIRPAESFYRDALGLDLMQRYGPSAAFLSAGGYHHHVGINTWAGLGAPPPPPDATGLRYFTIRLPSQEELDRMLSHLRDSGVALESRDGGSLVRDPSGNAVLLTA